MDADTAAGPHAEALELLGAWAVDACDGAEAAMVEAHLAACDACAAQARRLRSAAGWLSLDLVRPAPARLRSALLAEARRRRVPAELPALIDAYTTEVVQLDAVLHESGPEGGGVWSRPDPRHGDVRGVLAHLAANDAKLAIDLGPPVRAGGVAEEPGGHAGAAVRRVWRAQADGLARRLRDGARLDHPVRLAGTGKPVIRPLRDALVQRTFETWTHRDDLAVSLGGWPGRPPPPESIRRIVELAVALLPDALRAGGVRRPGDALGVELTGPGGGEWTVPLGHHAGVERVEVVLRAPAVEFCRLVANRVRPQSVARWVDGDAALAALILETAARLGCD